MKRLLIIFAWTYLLIFFLTIICVGVTYAFSFKKVLQLGAGAYTAFAIHETAHLLAADYYNRPMLWKDKILWCTTDSIEENVNISMAGLTAQSLSSEIILSSTTKNDNAYLNGILIANFLNEIIYPTYSYNRTGDFGSLRCSKKTKDFFAITFVTHGLFTLCRMYNRGHLNIRTNLGIEKDRVSLKFSKSF